MKNAAFIHDFSWPPRMPLKKETSLKSPLKRKHIPNNFKRLKKKIYIYIQNWEPTEHPVDFQPRRFPLKKTKFPTKTDPFSSAASAFMMCKRSRRSRASLYSNSEVGILGGFFFRRRVGILYDVILIRDFLVLNGKLTKILWNYQQKISIEYISNIYIYLYLVPVDTTSDLNGWMEMVISKHFLYIKIWLESSNWNNHL